MAKLYAFFPIVRTMCNLTFYMDRGRNIVRQKSSLTGNRVKKSPEFTRTRAYADLLAQASKIASIIYQALPKGWRQYWMFRAFTGEATGLLKAGKTKEEVIAELMNVYVEGIRKAENSGNREQDTWHRKQEPGYKGQDANTRRKYTKKDVEYWKNKTEKAIIKAQKRKAQQEKLQYYAGLMAKASKIGSVVYRSIPKEKRQYWQYKNFTGMAMGLLKNGLEEEMVTKFLRSEAGGLSEKTPSEKSEARCQVSEDGSKNPIAIGSDTRGRKLERKSRKEKYIPVRKKQSLFYIPLIQPDVTRQYAQKRRKRKYTFSLPPPAPS